MDRTIHDWDKDWDWEPRFCDALVPSRVPLNLRAENPLGKYTPIQTLRLVMV
jgi:hypothetical protein